jgi:hypothetical protein
MFSTNQRADAANSGQDSEIGQVIGATLLAARDLFPARNAAVALSAATVGSREGGLHSQPRQNVAAELLRRDRHPSSQGKLLGQNQFGDFCPVAQ